MVERFDRLAVEEPYDPLLKLARTLALNDLDQRRLLGNCLVDDGAKRALDLLALVVDAVQVELHPDAVIVPLRQRGCQAGDRAAAVEDGGAPGFYQIHWPNPEPDIEEGWAALAELKEQGLVRHIGVSNFDVEQLRRVQRIAPVETLQPPYSLVARNVERETLPFAEREGIGVIVYSPMGSGLLTGKMTKERIEQLANDDWRKRDPRFQEPQLSRHLTLVNRLQAIANRYDTTPGAVAVAWTLHNHAVDAAIVGFRRPDQVDPILPAADLALTGEDLTEIEGGTS